MVYRWMGGAHALAVRLRGERGQGTVEYVGLILLIAGLLAAVVVAGAPMGKDIGKKIVAELEAAIDSVGGSGGGGR
ncbi:MAG TPA: hypothetical protein VNZ62_11630 [Capillimicrobium sp.]|nr:hypothetical protein [Capillimicrobium sp.]